ncbi:hypothetical protein PHLGIDRAFT_131021 [Phlebiopsis gigantea 11061_1 CR5-6]|uniref:3-beta hydroxysteroid dehydrogenase/isomerase domain-containing protein n=1 Tax=Phlebiopsis gigantea (strain 11061_1 CR5-6) TaxID=745531 RepID=A0A0C3RZL1_PHLG1|nr:hypothetical protein PHLGIDRAFT_131021 [Phlebiopsis gigantea 11061_1 CR5-6]
MQSYIVLGGAGFLGRHIVSALRSRGVDRIAVGDLAHVKLNGVESYVCDVTDESSLDMVFKQFRPTCVIHAAAAPPSAGAESQWVVNYTGTRNAMNISIKYGVEVFVLSSDASVIFDGQNLEGVDESHGYPRYALHAYLDSKSWAESFVQDKNGSGGIRTICLRSSALFGPGSGWFVHPITDAFRIPGLLAFEVGSSNNVFDWTYVTNAADAHALAAEQLLLKRVIGGQSFIITNDEPRPFWSVPNAIYAAHHACGEYTITGVPPWLAKFVVGCSSLLIRASSDTSRVLMQYYTTYCSKTQWYNISKARSILGYRPLVTVDEGIRLTIEAQCSHDQSSSISC